MSQKQQKCSLPKINEGNYYNTEINMAYVSVSQYKSFMGTPDTEPCEALALAEAKGEYTRPSHSTSLLIGSYVDAALTGDLEVFKLEHPEIYSSRGSTKGELKSDFKQAQEMIDRARRDETFMQFLEGNHQVIQTGEIEGVPFKIKIDNVAYLNGKPVAIVDLKTVKKMYEGMWVKDSGENITWVEKWNYDLQGACYQYIYEQNTGLKLPFYIAAISKDKDSDGVAHPRLKIIQIPQFKLDERLAEVKANIWKVQALKNGEIKPIHCKKCDYCADTLPCEVISLDELVLEL